MIDWVYASLVGPKAYYFKHQLECLPIRHIIDDVLTSNTAEQTTLCYVAQLPKHVRIGKVILFQQFVHAFRVVNARKKNVELGLTVVHFHDGYFCLRDRLKSMEVIQWLHVLNEAMQEFFLTNILLAEH